MLVQPARTPQKAQLSAQPELSPLDFAAVKNLWRLSDAHHRTVAVVGERIKLVSRGRDFTLAEVEGICRFVPEK